MNPFVALSAFFTALIIVGNMEGKEAEDRFNRCMEVAEIITDSDIDDQIYRCEVRTGYTLPDDEHP